MLGQAITLVDQQLVRFRQNGIAAHDRAQIFEKLVHKFWRENFYRVGKGNDTLCLLAGGKLTSNKKPLMRIDGVVWLRPIVDKLASKHQVTPEEVEEAVTNKPKIRLIERGESKRGRSLSGFGEKQ